MRVEILGQERRRRWGDEQKLDIVMSVGVSGATVTELAHRHDVKRQLFKRNLPTALNDPENDLSPTMSRLLGDLHADLLRLEERIRHVTKEIEAIADREDVTRRLMTIPGIGALGATALLAAIGDGLQFRKARDLAAWLGLVPRQYSTGGNQTLLGISKRGNRYVRKLLMHGARSCFRHLDRTRDRLGNWLDGLEARMHPNKASQQGRRCTRGQDGTDRLGRPKQTGRTLRTQGSCFRLRLRARLQGSRRVMTKQWISMP